MSALDQAFIKAYSKESGATKAPPERRGGPSRPSQVAPPQVAPPRGEPTPVHFEDPYTEGHWYRVDAASEASAQAPLAQSAAPLASTTARKRKPLSARRPHVRFRPEPEPELELELELEPIAAASAVEPQIVATEPREPKLEKPQPAATPPAAPKSRPEAVKSPAVEKAGHSVSRRRREPLPRSETPTPPVSSDSFSPVFAVGYTDGWDSQLEMPAALLPTAYNWEPTTALVPQAIVEGLPAMVLPPPTVVRIDPPQSSAIARPHFPLPIVAAAERPTMEAQQLVEPAAAAVAEPPAVPTAEVPKSAQATEPEGTFQRTIGIATASAEQATEEATTTPKAEAAEHAPVEFDPAWEVERFSWPSNCDELLADSLDDWGLAVRQLLAAAKQGCKMLAVAGLRRCEGRSTLALCLARLAAQTGAKIALVDADFESPQLAELLGVGTRCDWHTAFVEDLPLSEAAILCLADQLTLIPLQADVPHDNLSFAHPAMAKLLRAAAGAHDLVVIDAGPIAGPEHAARWGGKLTPIDGVLLVRDLRRTDAEETAATVTQLRRAGLNRVMVLENFARAVS